MTTATAMADITAVGFSGLRRANTMSRPANAKSLRTLLVEGYAGVAFYKPYEDSQNNLVDVAEEALSDQSGLSDVAKTRLRGALFAAHDFLLNRPLGVPIPEVEVWDSGKIGFEWYVAPDKIVTATIDEHRRLAFSALRGLERDSGVRILDAQWPKQLIEIIHSVVS